MALTKITKTGIGDDAIDSSDKIADGVISEEHLDATAISGHSELAAEAANDDVLLVFDTSAGVIKKIQRSNVSLQNPTFTSVSPTNALTGDGTGNHTFTITGTKFDSSPVVTFLYYLGGSISASSTTRNSATQLTVVIPKSSLPNSGEPYDVVITNGSGLAVTTLNQINIDASPAFVTASGSVGSVAGGSAITPIDIIAADPESAGTVIFDVLTGGLPAGLSSTTVHENGVSKFRISGTPTNPSANTSTNFTLRASDAASNTSTRDFSLTVTRTVSSSSFTSSGTFAVPSGVSNLDAVLVVAGGGSGGAQHAGGGGAGGLVFMPCVPVTPGGTIAITIGCGGAMSSTNAPALNGQDSVFGASPSPGTSETLTAKGGGRGASGANHAFSCGSSTNCMAGGSGGGEGYNNPSVGGGTATQPTQSGNSGAYGFGNAGGAANGPYPSAQRAGGGGGGAGGAGQASTGPTGAGGNGGVGKAYTIADGTTPVFYAGGGGGSSHAGQSGAPSGGQGGGGVGGSSPTPGGSPNATRAGDGGANKGGGGGGLFYGSTQDNYAQPSPNIPCGAAQGRGGKGIVVVRF